MKGDEKYKKAYHGAVLTSSEVVEFVGPEVMYKFNEELLEVARFKDIMCVIKELSCGRDFPLRLQSVGKWYQRIKWDFFVDTSFRIRLDDEAAYEMEQIAWVVFK